MKTMRAYVIEEAGGPEKLVLQDVPRPVAKDGWVLIRVRAFGLNRSEWFTRRGESLSVRFPRVLGIECVGEVEVGGGYEPGQKVAAMMGDMGRAFDGSYAEFTLVPESIVFPLDTTLDWAQLAALPEMLQTVLGSLDVGLEVDRAKSLLIRGGTSSIGLTALSLAKARGLEVMSTTRSEKKRQLLLDRGADEVIVDDGTIKDRVRAVYPKGVDRVLELIGATTLLDSLAATRAGGVVCMTGILGGSWVLDGFRPMDDIPTGVKLTSYSGGAADMSRESLQRYVSMVERGELSLPLGPVFEFEDLVAAHQAMDDNRANGKMVVVVPG